ncbi:Phytanoyl-CoA dioxygenase (PhyH) [compost metagenome]
MTNYIQDKLQLEELGFATIHNIYSEKETEEIIQKINLADKSRDTFRKSSDLFAIRQFLKEIPQIQDMVFNENLKSVISDIFGADYFAVKSIYFDKPETSNWYVAYHQDLTISVDQKIDLKEFGPWTTKQNQFAVQPPIGILENNFTIRIHLDETDEQNGALKVIEKSHRKGIYRPESIDWKTETERICQVSKGGIMIMKPLLLHSSNRTTNNKKRRVIHIEFSNMELPGNLNWSERLNFA